MPKELKTRFNIDYDFNSDDFEKRVHRLDKDTSGILLIAKNEEALNYLQKQFKEE